MVYPNFGRTLTMFSGPFTLWFLKKKCCNGRPRPFSSVISRQQKWGEQYEQYFRSGAVSKGSTNFLLTWFQPRKPHQKKLVNRLRGVCQVGTPLHHFKNSLLSIKIAKKKEVNPWTYLWPERQNWHHDWSVIWLQKPTMYTWCKLIY